jgi:hypothetical protein
VGIIRTEGSTLQLFDLDTRELLRARPTRSRWQRLVNPRPAASK